MRVEGVYISGVLIAAGRVVLRGKASGRVIGYGDTLTAEDGPVEVSVTTETTHAAPAPCVALEVT